MELEKFSKWCQTCGADGSTCPDCITCTFEKYGLSLVDIYVGKPIDFVRPSAKPLKTG